MKLAGFLPHLYLGDEPLGSDENQTHTYALSILSVHNEFCEGHLSVWTINLFTASEFRQLSKIFFPVSQKSLILDLTLKKGKNDMGLFIKLLAFQKRNFGNTNSSRFQC